MDTYVDTQMSGVRSKTSTGRNVIADNEVKGNKEVMFQNEKEKNHQWYVNSLFYYDVCKRTAATYQS